MTLLLAASALHGAVPNAIAANHSTQAAVAPPVQPAATPAAQTPPAPGEAPAPVRIPESVTPATTQQTANPCKIEHLTSNFADQAYASHDYAGAESLYRQMLTQTPGLPAATAGLVRSQLAQWKLAEALQTATSASAAAPQDAVLMDVLGEVRLQRGEMDEAVTALNQSLALDACVARVHYGMGRYLGLKGMFASAQHQLDLAHELSPDDTEIGRAWTISRTAPTTVPEQIAKGMHLLENPNLTEAQRALVTTTIKKLQAREKGSCKLEQPTPTTTLKMAQLKDGAALDAEMNGHHQRLRIDTGASGLLMSAQAAANAGLVPEAEIKTGGFGDAGAANAYVTHVDRVKIGGLEYRNCLVRVVAKSVNLDTDGVIGTDVFRASVVTLDFPGNELRLTPLPPVPEGVAQEAPGEPLEEGAEAGAPSARKDRYIAPEMTSWTEVFRVGPQLIFPTRIGDAPRKLFLLDSGSTQGIISPEAAREVTQVTAPDPDKAHLHGISGEVNAVYQAQNVTIEFGGVRQVVERMTAIETTEASRWAGVEISGFIGYPTLREVVISIDYRDNLVKVVYNPKH